MPLEPSKTVCFDFDGTLCTNTGGEYDQAEPFQWAIERVNALAAAGYRIIIFTARGTATGIDWRAVTEAQLERWGVRYDELHLGKPSAAVYIDDRAVHTTDWQAGDAFAVPGFGAAGLGGDVERLPAPAPAPFPAAVEYGRTFSGAPLRLDEHVERARALAAGLGLTDIPAAEEIRAAVRAGIERAGIDDDLQYAIALAPPAAAALLDVWRDEPTPRTRVEVACRPVTELTHALVHLLDPGSDPPAVRATTAEQERPPTAWQLRSHADGSVGDALGGQLVIATDAGLVVEPAGPIPQVAAAWMLEHVPAGVAVDERPIRMDELLGAGGAATLGLPFGLLGLASVDGRALGYGPLLAGLRAAWAEQVGGGAAA